MLPHIFTHADVIWLLASIPLAWILQKIISRSLDRILHRRARMPANVQVKDYLEPSLFFVLVTIAFNAIVPFLTVEEYISGLLYHGFDVLHVVVWTWLLIRIVTLARVVLFNQLDMAVTDNLLARKRRTQFQFLEKILIIAIVSISLAIILLTFDSARRFGRSLIASAGLAGIIIGFAAQKTLASLMAGFQIAFTQPIRIDDVVVIEGEWGRIEEITLTYVVVCIWDRRRLIVPITYFIEKPIQNWTRTDATLLGYVYLYLDYSYSIDELRKEFERVLKSSPLWDGSVAVAQITETTEKTMQVRFLMSSRNSSESFDLRCLVREKLLLFIQQRMPSALPRLRLDLGPEPNGLAETKAPPPPPPLPSKSNAAQAPRAPGPD